MSRTLVALHAHPDDEALFTGARLALAARDAQRTVVICVTDGSLGFDPEGRTPLEEGHDRAATALVRSSELCASCRELGVDRLVELGIPDSGMEGWASMANPVALCNLDPEALGAQIAEVLKAEGPVTILTYADDGFYGHPDHVAVHRVALATARLLPDAEVEAVVMTPEGIDAALDAARREGGLLPEWLGRRLVVPHDEAEVVHTTHGASVASAKQRAVACHESQLDNAVLAAMAPGLFAAVFGTERYVRVDV